MSINNDTRLLHGRRSTRAAGRSGCDVPDSAGRYYVLQFVDAWTNNFAYVGHRATGTAAGELPARRARLGRRRARRRDGDPAPRRRSRRSSGAGRSTARPTCPRCTRCRTACGSRRPAPGAGLPAAGRRRAATTSRSSSSCACWMQAFPPAAARPRATSSASPRSACSTPDSPYADPAPPLAAALERRARGGAGAAGGRAEAGTGPQQNGWNLTYHVFDYNLDFFEVGALDDAAWKLPDDPARYVVRARGARAAGCGATTATRPPTRWSTSTAPASRSTARAATSCGSRSRRRSTRSGR